MSWSENRARIEPKHLGVDGEQESSDPLDNNKKRKQNGTSSTVIRGNGDKATY